MNSIEEAVNNRSENVATQMAQFQVDDQTYTDYGDYTFIWEKTYVKSPSRTQSGAMGPLDGVTGKPTFVTPHMTATYEIMPIADYRRLVKQALSKNEFTVICFDTIYNQQTTNKMYFATLTSPKYITRKEDDGTVTLVGVQNYTVELIGTNND